METNVKTRRGELIGLLGDLPGQTGPVKGELRSVEERSGYVLESLVLHLNGIEPVPAYLTRPRGKDGPYPAILFNHSHGGNYELGKEELIRGNTYLRLPPHAEALADQGYAALCIDAWAFGERSARSESAIFKQMLWQGRVLWGMMVYDSLRAIDYLTERPDIDAARIGTVGMSMGSTMAWWTAALDERIRVCAEMCSLGDYQALLDADLHDRHGIYYYVPSLMKHFTTAQINALTAPRPHLSMSGTQDAFTPPAALDKVDAELRKAYGEAGAPEAWELRRYPCGHEETPEMRADLLAFLARWL